MSYYPLSAGSGVIQGHAAHFEPWAAVRERYRAATGAIMWPYCGEIWDTGHVTGQTATTISDSTKAWGTAPKRWVSWTWPADASRLSYAPGSYDVVLYPDTPGAMPWQVIQLKVTDNSATSLTFSESLANYVTTGQITSDVVGWRYVIVKRSQYNWADRWPQWVNPHEATWGTADGGATDATHIQDNGLADRFGNKWAPGLFVGKDVVFRTAGGEQRRCTITASTDDTLTFTNPSGGTPFGPYAVVDAGAVPARPDRPHFSPTGVWYWGYTQNVWTLHPDADTMDATAYPLRPLGPVALPFQDVAGWVDGLGNPLQKYALDVDVWIAYDDTGNTPRDSCLSPFMFRTWRGLQVACEDLCTTHVEDNTHEGALSVRAYVPATLLWRAGINSFTGTAGSLIAPTSGASTQIQITGVTLPAGVTTPVQVYFAVRDKRDRVAEGFGVYNCRVSGGAPDTDKRQYGTLSGSGPTYTLTFNDASTVPMVFTIHNEGRPAVFSLGWTRLEPYAFRWFYDRTCFIPDLDGGGAVDPPTEAYPGYYDTRAKSTATVGYDELGDLFESDAFVTGKVAWYLGDNWHDTAYRFGRAVHTGGSGGLPATAEYTANFTERAPAAADRADYLASLHGTASQAGTEFQIRDATQSWADAVKTHTGTATGGSTTTLADTTKAASAFWDGTGGRWVGHTVRVTVGGTEHRRLITGYNAATQTLAWDEPLPVAAGSGTAYTIVEFTIRNRWRGRKVTVAGMGAGIVITGNDDTTLFWDEMGSAPASGAAYSITEELPGSAWKWSGTVHQQPTGTDARTGVAWRPGKNENHPDVRKRYGLAMKMDLIDANSPQPRNEIAAALKAMKGFQVTHLFRRLPSDATPAVDENPNDWAAASPCSYDSWNGGPTYDPLNPLTTGDAVSSADYFWTVDAGEEQDSFPLAVGTGAATRSLVGSAQTTHSYSASYHHRHSWGTYDIGHAMSGAVQAYSFGYYVWTIIPGLVPVSGGDYDPPTDDETIHPVDTDFFGGDAGTDLFGFGPGADSNSPHQRSFDANGADVVWRQMHQWASGTSPTTSGGTPAQSHTTTDPLGVNGKSKPNLPAAPTPPDNTTSFDVTGFEVTEATVVISPAYQWCNA